ncbi:MAG TPA: PHP domain-containing protein [Candidatus Manganitrophaceae bacterium]|nr:PHP domain-containing protein [Candidatus Manganitrophaceae bacterium]
MQNRFKGALHLHSVFSDGELALEALKERFKARGFDFLAMSDHAEMTTPEKMEGYVSRCRSLSDDAFLVIPGLEFAYPSAFAPGSGRLHLLGFGLERLEREERPGPMIDAIHRMGGVAVLAHPYPLHYPDYAQILGSLDGLELWNTKYNGRFAPALWNYRLLQEARKLRPGIFGFYGIDFHWEAQYDRLEVWVEAERLTAPLILEGLSKGAFYAEKEGTILTSDGRLTRSQEVSFARVERVYRIWRKLVSGGGRPFKMFGMKIPQRLKAMARKIL